MSAGTFQSPAPATGAAFALPGVLWLLLFVVVPAYALLAIAFGRVDFLFQPVPYWNPLHWNPGYVCAGVLGLAAGRRVLAVDPQHARVRRRSRSALCFTIGYPVAYYVARHAKRAEDAADRAAGDPVLGQLPAADARLDRPAGSRTATSTRSFRAVGITHPPDWLNGNAVLGDPGARLRLHPVLHPAGVRRSRPDRPQPDRGRARSRGDAVPRVPARHAAAQPAEHPRRLRARRAADVRRLLHQRPDLGLAAHEHARQRDQPVRPGRLAEEPRRLAGARADDDPGRRDGVLPGPDRARHENSWRPHERHDQPRGPAASGRSPRRRRRAAASSRPGCATRGASRASWSASPGLYIAWALVPVAIAILFSFNAGRSRSVWQGFSFRWWWGDPTQSIFHNAAYTHALVHSLAARRRSTW